MLLAHTFRAFRHRDYAIFWSGLFLGHTGTLIQTTAQSWLIFQLTDSPFYLGLEGFCLGLPRLLFEQPVRQSILHDVVPQTDLPNAVTLYQMVFNGSMLFGPAIGGLLIPVIDSEGCFFIATAGNLFVLVTIFLLRIRKLTHPAKSKGLIADTFHGLRLA